MKNEGKCLKLFLNKNLLNMLRENFGVMYKNLLNKRRKWIPFLMILYIQCCRNKGTLKSFSWSLSLSRAIILQQHNAYTLKGLEIHKNLLSLIFLGFNVAPHLLWRHDIKVQKTFLMSSLILLWFKVSEKP